jgi:plasmid maintenance system killer protein
LEFIFASQELQRLYTHNEGAARLPAETVTLFRRRVRHIEAAEDLQDLQDPRGVRCEELKGTDRFLLALTDKHGLVLSEEKTRPVSRIVVHEISEMRARAR